MKLSVLTLCLNEVCVSVCDYTRLPGNLEGLKLNKLWAVLTNTVMVEHDKASGFEVRWESKANKSNEKIKSWIEIQNKECNRTSRQKQMIHWKQWKTLNHQNIPNSLITLHQNAALPPVIEQHQQMLPGCLNVWPEQHVLTLLPLLTVSWKANIRGVSQASTRVLWSYWTSSWLKEHNKTSCSGIKWKREGGKPVLRSSRALSDPQRGGGGGSH